MPGSIVWQPGEASEGQAGMKGEASDTESVMKGGWLMVDEWKWDRVGVGD